MCKNESIAYSTRVLEVHRTSHSGPESDVANNYRGAILFRVIGIRKKSSQETPEYPPKLLYNSARICSAYAQQKINPFQILG